MKSGTMKPMDPQIRERARKEIEKGFDFSKLESKVITINLDNEIVNYFKMLSKKTGKGYQVLIREALHYFKDEGLEPKTIWMKQESKKD